MRTLNFPALSACLVFALASAVADAAPPPAFDHHDPLALNEFALVNLREGRLTTAWILLERAARLAPHDERIAGNLREIRAQLRGASASGLAAEEPSGQSAAGPERPARQAQELSRPLPALWSLPNGTRTRR